MGVRQRLRVDLRQAMKEREVLAVRALRSLLAAIDNAEAVAVEETSDGGTHVAKAAVGAGAGDRARRELTPADIAGIVQAEITERADARAQYLHGGRESEAEELTREIAVLTRYTPDTA